LTIFSLRLREKESEREREVEVAEDDEVRCSAVRAPALKF
jgi:hypothetical protein